MTDTQQVAVVSGVLNNRSIAYHIAQAMEANNIKVVYLVQDIHVPRVRKLLGEKATIIDYNALDPVVVQAGARTVAERYGLIDYLVHSVAFSDKAQLEGSFLDMTRENFINTLLISTYSFNDMCSAYRDVLKTGASVVTMTFRGSEKVAANYGPMGVAKAALESAMRYIAQELGEREIRVNAIAPGPVKTLAASGIGEFDLSLYMGGLRSAIGRNATAEEVGRTTLKLMQCEGITGAVLPVDYGVGDLVGMGTSPREKAAINGYRDMERAQAKAAKAEASATETA